MAYVLTQQLQSGMSGKGIANSSDIDDATLGKNQQYLNNLFNSGKGLNEEGLEVPIGKSYTGGSGIVVDANDKINIATVSAKPTNLTDYTAGNVIIVQGTESDDGVYVVQGEGNSKYLYLFAHDNTELNNALAETKAVTGIDKVGDFDETKDYIAGDICYYTVGDVKYLWRFLTAKPAGAWNGSESVVKQTTFYDELNHTIEYETVHINLNLIGGSGDLSTAKVAIKIGSAATVSYNVNKEGVVVDGDGNELVLTVAKGTSYTVAPTQIDGYGELAQRTYTAIMNNRFIQFSYSQTSYVGGEAVTSECVSVQIKGVTGTKSGIELTLTDTTDNNVQTATTDSNGLATFTKTVPIGHTYTVQFGEVSGYTTPSSRSLTAVNTIRKIVSYYVSQTSGVLLIDADFNELSTEQAAEDYNQVKYIGFNSSALQAATSQGEYHQGKNCSFMIRISDIVTQNNAQMCQVAQEFSTLGYADGKTIKWKDSDGVEHSWTSPASRNVDYDGAWNTDRIIADAATLQTAAGVACSSPAAVWAKQQTIVIGEGDDAETNYGYIGAYGQWQTILDNKDWLTSFWSQYRNGEAFPFFSGSIWSSTQCSATNMWYLGNGGWYNSNKTSYNRVVPFFDII